MIILNPLGGSNQRVISHGGMTDYQVNLFFAEELCKELRAKGEEVKLTRIINEAPPALNITKEIRSLNPTVLINIGCQEDLDPTKSGFIIKCDKYTALTGVLAYVLKKAGLSPVYPIGYTTIQSASYARLTDITIGLGYLSNPEDRELLTNDKLTRLAKLISTYAYGPSVKSYQPENNILIDDSYFLDLVWGECPETKTDSDTGAIVDEYLEGMAIKALSLSRSVAAESPYFWQTNIDVTEDGEYDLVLTARALSTDTKLSLRVGNDVTSLDLNNLSWSRKILKIVSTSTVPLFNRHQSSSGLSCYLEIDELPIPDPVPSSSITGSFFVTCRVSDLPINMDISYNKLFIGITQGSALITGVWLAKRGSIGKLDDNLRFYSPVPADTRPMKSYDPTNLNTSLIRNPITEASTLLGRASSTEVPNVARDLETMTDNLDSTQIDTKSFSDVEKLLTNALSSSGSPIKVPFIDPADVRPNYRGLESMVSSVGRNDKAQALLKAVNNMKSMERAAAQQLKSMSDRAQSLTKIGDDISKKSMGNLGKIGKLDDLKKLPGGLDALKSTSTAPATDQITAGKAKVSNLTTQLNTQVEQLKQLDAKIKGLPQAKYTEMNKLSAEVKKRTEKLGIEVNKK